MSHLSNPVPIAVLSPCIGLCRLDAAGLCVGCRRNVDEIMHWRDYDEARRRHIMDQVLPARGES